MERIATLPALRSLSVPFDVASVHVERKQWIIDGPVEAETCNDSSQNPSNPNEALHNPKGKTPWGFFHHNTLWSSSLEPHPPLQLQK